MENESLKNLWIEYILKVVDTQSPMYILLFPGYIYILKY